MADKLPINVLNAIFSGRWAIMPAKLDLLVSIANRSHTDIEAVLKKRAEYNEKANINVRDSVAIIDVFGPIIPRGGMFAEISGAISVQALGLKFGAALASPDVKGIIFNIDSPGGNIVNIHEFANQIYEARGTKPIVAYTNGLCASAAYWIASATDKIVTDKTSSLGSIGVVAAWTDDSKAREANGLIDYEMVSSQSPNKRSDYTSENGLAKLQAELDALADIFIENVARNRGKSTSTINDTFGQGGLMLADNAIKIGMADELGSLEGVIESIINNKSINSTLKKGIFSMSKKDLEDDLPDDKEKKDDKEKEGKTDAVDSMASVLASNPTLFNSIKQLGVIEERNRIKAIDEIGFSFGYSDIVRKAMFENPVSVEAVALQICKTQSNARALAADGYKEDAADMPKVPASGANVDSDVNAKLANSVQNVIAGYKGGQL